MRVKVPWREEVFDCDGVYFQPNTVDLPIEDRFWKYPGARVPAVILREHSDGSAYLLTVSRAAIVRVYAHRGTEPGCWEREYDSSG